jgi:hypothetical protein
MVSIQVTLYRAEEDVKEIGSESVNKKGKIVPYRRDIIDIAKHGSEMVTSKMNGSEVRSDF